MVLKLNFKNAILLVWFLMGMNAWGSGISDQLRAQQVSQLQSPDKSIALNVYLSATGEIQYGVQKSGVSVIQPSTLGVMMEGHDFIQRLKLVTTSIPERITDSYQTRNGKKSSILYQANQLVMSFTNEEEKKMDIIFRLSNDGVAFRYSFPWIENNETIVKELSSFAFDEKTKA